MLCSLAYDYPKTQQREGGREPISDLEGCTYSRENSKSPLYSVT
jgi:hypothetical protein